MFSHSSFLCAVLFTNAVHALSSPPSGAITIGPGGKHSTIQSAMSDTSSAIYFVFSGTYHEQVSVTRSNVKLYGQTSTPNSYAGNTVTITNSLPASSAGSNDASGTVRISGSNVALYNLNIANTFGNSTTHSQAIALSIQATQFGGYGLNLTGYQDTLLANKGLEFISGSLIQGAVDFIFGQQASLWITNTIINVVGQGWITASGRSSNDSNYYVIDNSMVRCGVSGATTYLGRPWRDYARVIFQNTNLANCVEPAGWSVWNTDTPNTDHVTFQEFSNTGTGATGIRANFSSKLSQPITINAVLPSTSWIDSAWR